MISERYSFPEFIERVKDMSYHDILLTGENEVYTAECRSYGVKGCVKAREAGSTHYAHQVKEFLFFMRYHMKPDSATEGCFKLYRIVYENLVRKKELKPEALEIFK